MPDETRAITAEEVTALPTVLSELLAIFFPYSELEALTAAVDLPPGWELAQGGTSSEVKILLRMTGDFFDDADRSAQIDDATRVMDGHFDRLRAGLAQHWGPPALGTEHLSPSDLDQPPCSFAEELFSDGVCRPRRLGQA